MDLVEIMATEAAKTIVANTMGVVISGARRLVEVVRRRVADVPTDPAELTALIVRLASTDPEFAAEVVAAVSAVGGPGATPTFPLPTGVFEDREAHRAQVAMPGVWLVAGPHGVGKSEFVRQVGADLAGRYSSGYAYIDHDGFRDGEVLRVADVKTAVLRQLGFDTDGVVEPDLGEQYRAAPLHGRFVLVFENVLSAEEIRSLALPWPASVVLVTTRRLTDDLRIWSPNQPIVLHGLDEPGAWRLLARRCGQAMLAAEPESTRQLLDRCDRLPFAVEQVGVRLARRREEPAAVSAFLAEFGTAVTDPTGVIRSCLDVTFTDLSPAVLDDLVVLAHHPGEDFTRASADALLGKPSGSSVDALLDVCLVAHGGRGRLRLHGVVRTYAARVHDGRAVDLDAAFDRVLAFYCDRAVEVDLSRGDRLRCYQPRPVRQWSVPRLLPMDWLEMESATVGDMVAQAHRRGRHVEVGQLCGVLELLLIERGHHGLCAAANEWGIASARALGDAALEARILSMQGRVFTLLHHFEQAQSLLDASLLIAQTLDNPRLLSSITEFRGRQFEESAQYASSPDYTLAVDEFQRCVAIDTEVGLPRGLRLHTRMLANVLVKVGQPGQALDLLGAAEGVDVRNDARVHTARAKAFAALGSLDQAQAEVEIARDLGRRAGANQYEFELADIEADIAVHAGAADRARAIWGQAAERYFHAGHPKFNVYLRLISRLPPPRG